MILQANTRIVLMGDSITDHGVSYGTDPEKLGNGYPRYIRDYIYYKYPELNVSVINKGVSGERTSDLLKRWEKDVLDLNPDILSICIGTNDVWRQFDRPEMNIIDAGLYEENLRKMLSITKEKINPVVILFEIPPVEKGFTTYQCSKALETDGNALINQYNRRVYKVASDYNTYFCPINKILSSCISKNSTVKYTYDGVHPSSAGIMTFAMSFMNTLNL
jgi:Lysophospholipase L1 and related esterases